MRTYYWMYTAYSTIRVYIRRADLTPKIFNVLNCLSIWGGIDKETENSVSWEINYSFENALKQALNRLDYTRTEDYTNL